MVVIKNRLRLLFFVILFSVCCIVSNTVNVFASSFNDDNYYLGGYPAGFSLETKGACVVGLCDVITLNGIVCPAKDCGIKSGDIILEIDGNEVNNANDIEKNLSNKQCNLHVQRGETKYYCVIEPALDINNKYKLGIYIKDKISGIGTITYYHKGRFASLGHPVLNDCGSLLNINGGKLYSCSITGYVSGEKGKAGELKGIFLNNKIADIDTNYNTGVYGNVYSNYEILGRKIELGEGKIGQATIISTIDGNVPKEYSVSIVKSEIEDRNTKNFIIKITDKELLSKTGGIVQGMSGSPIVQNGKLVGAVTHVFINDPTRGYGISIKYMIDK